MLLLTISACLFGAARASADTGMPLDHTQYLSDPATGDDPLLEPMDAEHLPGGGKWAATAHSRLESELKVSVPDAAHYKRMRTALDQLAKDPKLAQEVLGKGWTIQYKHDADYGDTYLDDKNRTMAQHLAGIRRRTVNGENAELNVKTPGGLQTGPDGVILTRSERGLPLGPKADLAAIARVKSKWNPVTPLAALRSGDLGELMSPSVGLKTKRGRYVLGYAGPGADSSWHSLVDLSADHIYEIKDLKARGKKTAKVEPIFGLEGDLNHPGAASGLAVPNVEWNAPHTAADAHRPEFHDDAAVKALHTVGPKLLGWMKTAHGVSTSPALPKYTQAALNLGVVKQSQIRPNARR